MSVYVCVLSISLPAFNIHIVTYLFSSININVSINICICVDLILSIYLCLNAEHSWPVKFLPASNIHICSNVSISNDQYICMCLSVICVYQFLCVYYHMWIYDYIYVSIYFYLSIFVQNAEYSWPAESLPSPVRPRRAFPPQVGRLRVWPDVHRTGGVGQAGSCSGPGSHRTGRHRRTVGNDYCSCQGWLRTGI